MSRTTVGETDAEAALRAQLQVLRNFELTLAEQPCVLLIGKNGSGKSTIGIALELLQKIARGTNRVGELIKPQDLTVGRTQTPARFEVEATIGGRNYIYSIAFEFPSEFREMRVADEKLLVDGTPVYSREVSQVRLARNGASTEAIFGVDWHLAALPIVQERNSDDPLYIFKNWLSSLLLLRPAPSLVRGDSAQNQPEHMIPNPKVEQLGGWFSAIVSAAPSAYTQISDYLKQVMPDFIKITNPTIGKDLRSLAFHFYKNNQTLELPLEELSDGEKCFVIFALAIAENSAFGPSFCFWDEPENYLAPDEVGHAVLALRRAYKDSGQLVVTSHNPEAIRMFSEAGILFLSRHSHLEPTIVTPIEAIRANGLFEGGLVDALIRGDVHP